LELVVLAVAETVDTVSILMQTELMEPPIQEVVAVLVAEVVVHHQVEGLEL
jgi:hypothetical protein